MQYLIFVLGNIVPFKITMQILFWFNYNIIVTCISIFFFNFSNNILYVSCSLFFNIAKKKYCKNYLIL